ncbi:ABC transporter substrate-binding protein [Hydrogenophaga sp.]|uniref:ABC transporter substrate-binding protein n=1 Tax=Hydrogenophaga sp. TaxID=1904254 RepID=UPI00271B116B|nr:ABC transporter substrate-binding protein [Hydrogenophaga sp.]MDO9436944.1 ABC transporter substrate-binding protein [Hydrogenophaga sp.]
MKRRDLAIASSLFTLAAGLPLAALSQPAGGKIARVVAAVATEPDNLDPSLTRSAPVSRPTMDNVFMGLVMLDAKGDPVPGLAEWKYSPDGKTLTFVLRQGLTFHNGTPVTAQDVVFSHERMVANTQTYSRNIRSLDKVEVVDDRTVRFVFKTPTPIFIRSYLPIMSKAYLAKVGEAEFVAKPVGAGPYSLVQHVRGQYVELKAFDKYFEGVPAATSVRVRFIADPSARVAALRSGEVDIIMTTPYADVQELTAAGFKTVAVPSHPTVSLTMNMGNPNVPWSDVRVRKAIAHAIDADSIVKGLFFGVPKRFARLAPGEVGYDASLKPYEYNVALSKQLLTEAGFANGFDMKLFYYVTSAAGFRETAEAVTLLLRKVGIRATIEGIEGARANEQLRAMTKDLSTAVWVAIVPHSLANWGDPADALSLSVASKSPLSVYRNAEFDKLVEAALTEVDTPKRADHLRQALKIIHDDVGSVPIFSTVEVFAFKKGFNYQPIPRSAQSLNAVHVSKA